MNDIVRKYYDRKIKCPICNRMVAETYLTPPEPIPNREYADRVNRVMCNECGWQGVVDQLKG